MIPTRRRREENRSPAVYGITSAVYIAFCLCLSLDGGNIRPAIKKRQEETKKKKELCRLQRHSIKNLSSTESRVTKSPRQLCLKPIARRALGQQRRPRHSTRLHLHSTNTTHFALSFFFLLVLIIRVEIYCTQVDVFVLHLLLLPSRTTNHSCCLAEDGIPISSQHLQQRERERARRTFNAGRSDLFIFICMAFLVVLLWIRPFFYDALERLQLGNINIIFMIFPSLSLSARKAMRAQHIAGWNEIKAKPLAACPIYIQSRNKFDSFTMGLARWRWRVRFSFLSRLTRLHIYKQKGSSL